MIAVAISIIDWRHSIQSTAIYTYIGIRLWETRIPAARKHISLHEPAILKWTTELARFWLYNMYVLISDAHTRMGQCYVPYAYGTSDTRMGQHTHMGQNSNTDLHEDEYRLYN